MKIAVVTGASSGIGREFAERIAETCVLDEMWVIARREDRLEELKSTIKVKVRTLALDLSDGECIERYRRELADSNPDVRILVNASGFGRLGEAETLTNFEQLGMIDLNIRALTEITLITLKYMSRGARIYQMGSLSAFQPIPYMSVYAATKAYVLSYSRSMNVELAPRGIRMIAVCPGWVRTEFLDRAEDENGMVVYYNGFVTADVVVRQAFKDMKKGKDVSICGGKSKATAFLTKHISHRTAMKIWCGMQRRKRNKKCKCR